MYRKIYSCGKHGKTNPARELEAVIERAVINSAGPQLRLPHPLESESAEAS